MGLYTDSVRKPPNLSALKWVMGLLAALLTFFLLLPLLALLLVGSQAHTAWQDPGVQDALRISFQTTSVTLLLTALLGTPLAWILARGRFPGQALLESALTLPMLLPPVVAGVALLLTFGRQGWLGQPLSLAGMSLAFSPAAVVLAQLFVSAPFYVQSAKTGFAAFPREIIEAARMDGAGDWALARHIVLPLSWPFLVEGLMMSWARALGEFGATILFAGSLEGQTRTIPLAIYAAMESSLGPALMLSALMMTLAFMLLVGVRLLKRWAVRP